MQHLREKINYLTWLKAVGIEYYLTDRPKNMVTVNHKQDLNNVLILRDKVDNISIPIDNSPISFARALADKAASLEELKNYVMNFEHCELKKFATNTVFADGNANDAKIMFIGEAPGANEDAQGIPFCGESGKLLDNMLKSIGISRQSNAYITNTIFWRPPANRTPTQHEIDICRPFVEKHIALINPQIIVLVGATAVTSLFGKHLSISKIRQEYYSYTNKYLLKPISATSIFHPAYLLRQPLQKKTTWYDLLKLQQFIVENS